MMRQILIADDEPIERVVISKIIRQNYGEQLEILQAGNGREAIARFEESSCQIVLLDIEMPGINGLEAAEEIRKRSRTCSIIFLTAFDTFSYAKKAISVRALDYLLKPCSLEELIADLDEAIRLADENEERRRQERLADRNKEESRQEGPSGRNKEESRQEGPSGRNKEEGRQEGPSDRSKEESRQEGPSGRSKEESRQEGPVGRNKEESRQEGPAGRNKEESHQQGHADGGKISGLRSSAAQNLILDFIQCHYMEDISLQDVAGALNYSDAYFCKLFKQCFDKNFTAYIAEFRVEMAKTLLADVTVNIKEISERVGYRDSNYFTKVFKRIMGMTPSEYRAQELDT